MKRPIAALMQPTFMPWQGYFALLDQVDVFVHLDDFQFSRQSFQQRNRLFVSGTAPGWITVPVAHSSSSDRDISQLSLNSVSPCIDARFRKKFQGLLTTNYRSCAFFDEIAPVLLGWINDDYQTLAALNIALINRLAHCLDIATTQLQSSQMQAQGKRSDRVASLLRKIEATTYIAANGAFDYMHEDAVFPLADIQVFFQQFVPASYPQRQSREFVSHLSVVDLLFQVGPSLALDVIRQGNRRPLSWMERLSQQSQASDKPY
ncbi:conserved hypothetical protein [Rhodospirillaceae bacterium LM-1]|nr:conserved hypothetical protein [Rhodospirillaceae bacterium LM-1]